MPSSPEQSRDPLQVLATANTSASRALFSGMIAEQGRPPEAERVALVRAAAAGDRRALDELVRALWPSAYKIAWSVLRNAVAAEDAAQDACAQVAANITRLRSAEAFTTWFYRIAVRAATRYRARPLDDLPEMAAGETASIEDRLDLGAQILRLPEPLRIALVLRYYFECNSTEIAAILGIPAGTVRFRLAGARERLRAALTAPSDGGGS
jgi:RNA polymerase sigma-70 factor (ECF subfamily)